MESPLEATQSQGATVERLVGILGASESDSTQETTKPEVKTEVSKAATAKPEETSEVVQTEVEEPTETNESEEAEQPEEDATDVVQLPTSLPEIAEALSVDQEKLFDIKVKTKIDGQDGEVTLGQLIKSYQTEGHITRKSMELSEQRKAFDQEAQRVAQAHNQRVQQLDDAFVITQNLINERYKSVDWEQLKATDPNAFNTAYIEYQQHQHQLAQAYQTLQSERQRVSVEQQQQFVANQAEEQKLLVNKIPEWANKDIAKKESGEIQDYLKSYGYTQEEINQVYDHRWVMVLRDAAKARSLQNSKPQVMKKVVTAPKLAKPGAKASQDGETQRLRDLKNKHRAGDKNAGIEFLKRSGLAD